MELNIVIRNELVDTMLKWFAQYDKGVFFSSGRTMNCKFA